MERDVFVNPFRCVQRLYAIIHSSRNSFYFIVPLKCTVTRVGAAHMRVQLIKKAKVNGDILGFLV
jgi:hypothetical protein